MANAILNVGQTGGQVNISTAAAPATPAAGVVTLYAGTDKALHALNSDGVDITIAAAGASSPITVQNTTSLVSTGVGATAATSVNCALAIGNSATLFSGATGSIVLGNSSVGGTGACNSIIIGNTSRSIDTFGPIIIGANARACSQCITSTAPVAAVDGGVVIGNNNQSTGLKAIVVGNNSIGGAESIIIGNNLCSLRNFSPQPNFIIGNCIGGIDDYFKGGIYALASNFNASSDGNQVIVGSGNNTTLGRGAVVVGRISSAGGIFSVNIGNNNASAGNNSVVIGDNSTACSVSDYGIAIGKATLANGVRTLAMGTTVCATACCAMAFGSDTTSSHAGAVVIGANLSSEKTNTTHVNSLIAYGQAASKTNVIGATGGTVTLNWDNSNIQTLTLDSNISTLTKSNPIDGAVYTLFLTQGASGGYTVAWGADVDWAGGTGPTLSTAIGAVDAVSLVYIAGVTGYYGNANLNFS